MISRLEKFEKKVALCPMSGCWLWLGGVSKTEYGKSYLIRGEQQAHRVSWILHGAKISTDKCVLHRCDVRSCVNPDHLFIGTQQENIEDCIRKGRSAYGDHNRNKTHCKCGLPLSGDNLRVYSRSRRRSCRACHNANQRGYKQRLKARLTKKQGTGTI